MPVTLSTILTNITTKIKDKENSGIIQTYSNFMRYSGKSESYQKQNLKCMISFSVYLYEKQLGRLTQVTTKDFILDFLNSKQKSVSEDPDQKWITTWNDYLARIRRFYRWLT